MSKIIVAGIGTDVGKTLVSTILTMLVKGDYWKPVECGDSDSGQVSTWLDPEVHHVYPPAYSLKAPYSPHKAARLESLEIDVASISPPKTNRPLVIESAGGIFVPLTTKHLSFDAFRKWDARWVVVSRHYLGSINHTLLTLETLKQKRIDLAGIIFNGEPCLDSESAILGISKAPQLGRLLPEKNLNKQTLQRYAEQWQSSILHFLH